MSQPLRQENSTQVNLITTRTERSRLWFVNNPDVENQILASLARYQSAYGVTLYAFVLQGNHDHLTSSFPNANRAEFMRDLNSQVARICKRLIPEVGRGKFWERRYANQELPRNEDIEEYFFYCALQPVRAGLTEHPKDYPGYNSFEDAINETEREFVYTDWARFRNAQRFNRKVDITRYQKTYKLKYSRLPGYEHLTRDEYRALMLRKFEAKRMSIIEERRKAGYVYPSSRRLTEVRPGSEPKTSKTSKRHSPRPLVLSSCERTRSEWLSSYFSLLARYRDASTRYLSGEIDTSFPSGTYRPPLLCHRSLQE